MVCIGYNTAARDLPDIHTYMSPRVHSAQGCVCVYLAIPRQDCVITYILHF